MINKLLAMKPIFSILMSMSGLSAIQAESTQLMIINHESYQLESQ
jgi:hypothetical protein